MQKLGKCGGPDGADPPISQIGLDRLQYQFCHPSVGIDPDHIHQPGITSRIETETKSAFVDICRSNSCL